MVSPKPAYQKAVDGFVLPADLGGHAALDLCNTLAGRDDRPVEYLRGYDHLAAWAGGAGLVERADAAELRRRARREPREAERVVERTRALREALYASLTGGSGWEDVAAAAHEALAALVLVRGPDGGRFELPPDTGLDLPRLAAARAAGELLASPLVAKVRRCPGDGCGWLFLDLRGRRRWCSMGACGNRAKVRRHAARARGR